MSGNVSTSIQGQEEIFATFIALVYYFAGRKENDDFSFPFETSDSCGHEEGSYDYLILNFLCFIRIRTGP